MNVNTGVALTPDSLKSMKMAKVFSQHSKHIVSLDFDDSGEFCVTASEDESIGLYDCLRGKLIKTLFSKKYGIHLCRFSHSSTSILHSSTKEDDTIRYLSLHDNQYLRYFRGHSQRVVSLDVSTVNDMIISGSLDDTVRIWDLRSPNCQGLCNIAGAPMVSIDRTGLVFAIGLDSKSVRLYDARLYDKGPFSIIPTDPSIFSARETWTDMRFSQNGRDMLIATASEKIFLIDSLDGNLRHILTDFENKVGLKIQADFTPDGNYILGGSQDGKVHVWEVQSGQKLAELGSHSGAVGTVRYNPRYNVMASACSHLAFWLPHLSAPTE